MTTHPLGTEKTIFCWLVVWVWACLRQQVHLGAIVFTFFDQNLQGNIYFTLLHTGSTLTSKYTHWTNLLQSNTPLNTSEMLCHLQFQTKSCLKNHELSIIGFIPWTFHASPHTFVWGELRSLQFGMRTFFSFSRFEPWQVNDSLR